MTRKILERLLAIFLLACGCAWGQAQPPSAYQAQIITFQGAPFGPCDVYQVALDVVAGNFYYCKNRVWTLAANPGSNIAFTGADSFSQQITSTVATGTAPFSIASTTQVTNLNAQLHGGLTAPASAIVGLTDTQTLTNKTLTGASSGNTTTLLNAQANAAAITGTGAAATVYTYTLPANTVANLKGFRLSAGWIHSTGTASVTYNVTLNGVSVSGGTFATATVGAHTSTWTVLNTGSTTGTAQFTAANSAGTQGLNANILAGLAWSSPQVLTLTFNVAATDQVTPIQWLVELIQ